MTHHTSDLRLKQRVDEAADATLAWLSTMRVDGQPMGVHRISKAHDAAAWPGMLLPATYNAVMCLGLLGDLQQWSSQDRAKLAAWLERFRRDDGIFRVPGMSDDTIYKKPDLEETWRYIDFHVTNYALGAIEALDPERPRNLSFAEIFLDPLSLKAWLSDRDLRDPWLEGNNIVNLASFLIGLETSGTAETKVRARNALSILFDWHDRNQDPTTGFWGIGQTSNPVSQLHAMAGSMHNFHLWYIHGRPLPYQEKAVDYTLTLPTSADSACIDVDEIDLLAHAYRSIDHRREDIEAWLREKLEAVLALQNDDGGFPDVHKGVRRQDGWIKGYEEPQGLSNTFATWFRWIAIAMADEILWPARRQWSFRKMIGIGFRVEGRRS